MVPQDIVSMQKLLDSSSGKQKPLTCEEHAMACKVSSTLAPSVSQYLSLVNFRHFSAEDLVHVVAPMEIVPSSCIHAALQFHELRGPNEREEQNLGWTTCYDNRKLYTMDKDTCRIQQHEQGRGYAYNQLFIDRNASGIHEWEIIIEQVCKSHIEVGLVHFEDADAALYRYMDVFSDPRSGRDLSEIWDAYAVRMDDNGISIHQNGSRENQYRWSPSGTYDHIHFGKDCSELVYGRHYAHKDSKVKISLDIPNATCSVSVDDEDFGVAWTELPAEAKIYFPAVSLGSDATGAVRIRVLRAGERDFTSSSE